MTSMPNSTDYGTILRTLHDIQERLSRLEDHQNRNNGRSREPYRTYHSHNRNRSRSPIRRSSQTYIPSHSRPISPPRRRNPSPPPRHRSRSPPRSHYPAREDSKITMVKEPPKIHKLPPPVTKGLAEFPISMSVIETDNTLRTMQHAGKWLEAHMVRNLFLVGRAYQRLKAPVPDACQYIIDAGYSPLSWMHDAAQTHKTLYVNDQWLTFAWSFQSHIPPSPTPMFLASPASQAAWLALQSNPTQFPGVAVATDLSVDLATIPGHDLYQRTRPRNANETGYCTAVQGCHHFLFMMVYLLSQVALYEQLVLHYCLDVVAQPPSANLVQPFDRHLAQTISLEELVKGLAQRGVTFDMAHDAHAWAMHCLNDLLTIYPDLTPQLDTLILLVAERLRVYGVPPSSIPSDSRIWVPPSSWDLTMLFNDRELWIVRAGQLSRGTFNPMNARERVWEMYQSFEERRGIDTSIHAPGTTPDPSFMPDFLSSDSTMTDVEAGVPPTSESVTETL